MGKFRQFLTQLSARHRSAFSFPDDDLSKYWECTLIFWRSCLGLIMDKFCQFLTNLSVRHTIGTGYYRSTILYMYSQTLMSRTSLGL